jgi:hypothetical protein
VVGGVIDRDQRGALTNLLPALVVLLSPPFGAVTSEIVVGYDLDCLRHLVRL